LFEIVEVDVFSRFVCEADELPVEEVLGGGYAGVIDIMFPEGKVKGLAGLIDQFAGDGGNGEFEVILTGEVGGDLGIKIRLVSMVFGGELPGLEAIDMLGGVVAEGGGEDLLEGMEDGLGMGGDRGQDGEGGEGDYTSYQDVSHRPMV